MNDLSPELIVQIAQNVIAGFLAQFGMVPSEGGTELKCCGPYSIVTIQSKVPSDLEESIDGYDVFQALTAYLSQHNTACTAVRYYPYDARVYFCPCGCGTFLFVSVYHTTS